MLRGLNILLVSNEPWGDVWYSKHNYAYELAKDNHVTFVGPPERWRPRFLKGCNVSCGYVANHLAVLHYNNVLPARPGFNYHANNTLVSRAIGDFLERSRRPTDLFISFDPARLYAPRLLGAKASLFIAVDKYRLTLPGERHLYANVDGVVTISRSFNQLHAPFNKPILTIGHGISSEEFSAVPTVLNVRDYGLYVGTIDQRVDIPLVRRMVEAHPEVPFVFIGHFNLHDHPQAKALFSPGTFPNVHFLGAKPFKQLKSFIAGARFCLAPMDISYPGNDISHHKVFQYLAMGKPVFSTEFSEYTGIADLLYMNNDPATLVNNLSAFLSSGEDAALPPARIAVAREHSYDSILGRIGDFLANISPGLRPGPAAEPVTAPNK